MSNVGFNFSGATIPFSASIVHLVVIKLPSCPLLSLPLSLKPLVKASLLRKRQCVATFSRCLRK